GDLARFPFEQGDGAFSVDSKIRDAVIDYAPGWPRVEGIQARMLFQGKTMEVTSTQARIFNVALAPVRVVIPNLLLHDNMLLVDGQAQGPAQDFVRYANSSPVGGHLRGFVTELDARGTMQLGLKMQIPMRHSKDTTMSGTLSLQDNRLAWAGLPPAEQARGEIVFTEKSLAINNLAAQFLGGPLRVDTTPRPGQGPVQIRAQGQASVAGVATWLSADLAQYLWRARPGRIRSARAGFPPAGAASEARCPSAAVVGDDSAARCRQGGRGQTGSNRGRRVAQCAGRTLCARRAAFWRGAGVASGAGLASGRQRAGSGYHGLAGFAARHRRGRGVAAFCDGFKVRLPGYARPAVPGCSSAGKQPQRHLSHSGKWSRTRRRAELPASGCACCARICTVQAFGRSGGKPGCIIQRGGRDDDGSGQIPPAGSHG
ncbi:MAG: hypothetical protein B7Y21_02260, partial [Hydrogenophilales bacterium 16-61-112]